jgi:hypothetical protein
MKTTELQDQMSVNVGDKHNEQDEIVRSFTWGRVRETYEVGPYFIVVYYPRIAEGCVVTKKIDTNEVTFHPYVLRSATRLPADKIWSKESSVYRDTSQGYQTLDEALAGAIAFRNEGINHRADRYFIQSMNERCRHGVWSADHCYTCEKEGV